MEQTLLLAFLLGVGSLLVMILVFKINAFLSLLISSIVVGISSGMELMKIVDTVISGMSSTLGFVATIVGLGAIFGALLEYSGATEKLAQKMLSFTGEENAPYALSIAGFFIAVPVFFDVAFIILVPVIYALQKKTGKSLLIYAIPLLASLAVTHAFIPPTPGPIAVADIIGADLGWVIYFGFIIGFPTAIIAGILWGNFIGKKIHVSIPPEMEAVQSERLQGKGPGAWTIIAIILFPIVLILFNTVNNELYPELFSEDVLKAMAFIGHPIVALLLTTLICIFYLRIKYHVGLDKLQELSMKSLGPAGIIILITGAGGVFKTMLTESGAGALLAQKVSTMAVSPIILSFMLALIVRLMQGSATVAMITAAGIMGTILSPTMAPQELALIVLSIAAGASGFSHVNDSGFWLVNRYLGISEVTTLKTWTAMTGILSITALILILILSAILSF